MHMASSPRRKSPKSPAVPIDLEEIEQDPGFRGMLSFLEVSPESRNATSPLPPTDQPPTGEQSIIEPPTDQSPPTPLTPRGNSPADDSPTGHSPVSIPPAGHLRGPSSIGHIPYMDV